MDIQKTLSMIGKNIVIIDGDCVLCSRSASFLSKIDKNKRLEFIPYSSSKGREYLKEQNLINDIAQYVVYITPTRTFIKSDAIIHMTADTGALQKAVLLLLLVPKFIRDKIYDYIAAKRRIF